MNEERAHLAPVSEDGRRSSGHAAARAEQLATAARHHGAAAELQDQFDPESEAAAAAVRSAMATRRLEKLLQEQQSPDDSAPLPQTVEELVAECQRLRREVASLRVAVETNRRISYAVGILMNRHLLTTEQAFMLLVGQSQKTNRKLREIAEEVVVAGDLP